MLLKDVKTLRSPEIQIPYALGMCVLPKCLRSFKFIENPYRSSEEAFARSVKFGDALLTYPGFASAVWPELMRPSRAECARNAHVVIAFNQ